MRAVLLTTILLLGFLLPGFSAAQSTGTRMSRYEREDQLANWCFDDGSTSECRTCFDLKREKDKPCKLCINPKEVANCFMLGNFWIKNGRSIEVPRKFKDQNGEEYTEIYYKRDQKTGEKFGKLLVKEACIMGVDAACTQLKGGILMGVGSDIIFYASIVLIGIAALLISRQFFMDEEEFKASEKLEDEAGGKDEVAKHGIVLRYSRPFFRRYVVPIVHSFKASWKKKIKDKYKRKLSSAGLTVVLSPEDFYSFKLFLIVGFPVLYLALRAFLEESWPLSYVPAVALFGFFYPDIWIKGKIEQRQQEIIRAMPFAVDMLALSVEAGLDFVAAMSKVVEKAKPSALTWEFEQMMKEIKIGASRAESLRNMAWRIDLIQISSFCATLIAADSVGASIGPILKALSAEIRQKRSADAEKAGATAATKILFPMLFLIVPAVFIVVAAPIMLEFILGGSK